MAVPNKTTIFNLRPTTPFIDVTKGCHQCVLNISSLALTTTQTSPSTQSRHGSTSCSSNLIGYSTDTKKLSPLVPIPTHSPNYMFPAFCLDSTGTCYYETPVTKYQQRRTTSRNSEDLHFSDIYKL